MQTEITTKLDEFFSKFPERQYPKGQILIFAGDEPDYVYFLTAGKVRQYDISYRGDEVVLNTFKPHAFFPMSSVLLGVPHKFFFDTETDVTLRQAPANAIVDFIEANPEISLDLLKRVYIGTEGMLGRMSYLMTGSAQSRLIYELVIEAKRFGEIQTDGSVTLDINEKALGARVGLSRETVSREIHKLKKQDLLNRTRAGIYIRDLNLLEQKLGGEL